MSEVAAWNCQFLADTGKNAAPLENLTVGAEFTLKCHGDIAVKWDQTLPQAIFATPQEDHSLQVLQSIELQPNDVQFKVTSYRAGEHKPEYIRFVQGKGTVDERGFEFAKPAWVVKSVLDPKAQPPPEPYGPFGPFSLSLPLWFWLALLFVVVAVTFAIWRTVRKVLQRRKMLEELSRHKTALLPIHQLYKETRGLRRQILTTQEPEKLKPIAAELDKQFRLYVLRRFQIPTLDWSNADILRDLKRRHRTHFDYAGVHLRRALRELDKMNTQVAIKPSDLEQVQRMSLEAAERLDQAGGAR